MATRHHPASVAEIDDALGIPHTQHASKKIAAAEQLLDLIDMRHLARSGRTDRAKTALLQRLRIIAAVAVQRPPDEFERWIDQYWADRYPQRRRRS